MFASEMMKHSKVNQTLLVGVKGTELTPETAALYRKLQPGGYVLFSRNIQRPGQVRKLVDDLRDLSVVEPILSIDQEGGRVSRLRELGNEPPSARDLRMRNDLSLSRRHGQLSAELLRIFGMNVNLAPVLDLSFSEEADNSLRGRCYGTGVDEVLAHAGAYIEGLHCGGVACCGKHFPGIASAEVDPHRDLPKIVRRRERLMMEELQVFQKLLPKLDSIMSSHAWYTAFDREETPASLSLRVIRELLREELGYTGLVMTDDLDMGALLNLYTLEESLHRALHAGNDMLMLCHRLDQLEVAARAMAQAPTAELDRALEHVASFKMGLSAPGIYSDAAFTEIDTRIGDLRVDTLGAEKAAIRSPGDGKRSPVEEL